MDKAQTQSKEQLLKSIEEVLNEALKEYEQLSKMEGLELAEDPSRPMAAAPEAEEEAAAQEEAAAPEAEEQPEAKEDDEEEEEDEDKENEDEEQQDDDALKSEFAAIKAKMEQRGLIKSEYATEAKAETKTQTSDIESLKKSHTDQIEILNKTIAALTEKVEKIASAPVPRKGVSGLTPLRKSEGEGQNLSKTEVINKLLDLKKSGKAVDTALITRIETNRASDADFAVVKSLIG